MFAAFCCCWGLHSNNSTKKRSKTDKNATLHVMNIYCYTFFILPSRRAMLPSEGEWQEEQASE